MPILFFPARNGFGFSLWAIAAAFLFCAAETQPSQGQETPPVRLNLPQVATLSIPGETTSQSVSSSEPRPAEHSSAGEGISAQTGLSDPACPDFWIVSSRHCQDPKCTRCCGCRLEYYHREPSGCLYQKNCGALQAWLQPGVPVCVIVHGSFSNWHDVRLDSHRMYRWIRCAAPHWPLQIVFFTWPSGGPTQVLIPLDISILGRRGARHGIFLAQLLSEIPPGHPITTFGHSHGARAVAATMHLLGGGDVQGLRFAGCEHGNPIRVVLSAAAMDHHWLTPGERYGRALCRADRLLLLRNDEDCVLHLYPFRTLFSRSALSARGFSREDCRRLGSLRAKTSCLDVSSVIGHHHFWNNYYVEPSVARAIAPFIYFADAGYAAHSVNAPHARPWGSAPGDPSRPPVRESSTERASDLAVTR